MAAESNVRAVLRVRGTSKLTDLGLRYCADERLTGFVEDDARVLNRSQSPARIKSSKDDGNPGKHPESAIMPIGLERLNLGTLQGCVQSRIA